MPLGVLDQVAQQQAQARAVDGDEAQRVVDVQLDRLPRRGLARQCGQVDGLGLQRALSLCQA